MLVFVDESGYPLPTDASVRSVLLSVCIKETDIRNITQQFYQLKERIYQKQSEIKSTNLINPKTILKKHTHNQQYTESVLDILDAYDTSVFAVIMEKPDFIPYTQEGLLPVQYYYLLQRIEYFCDTNQTLMAMCVFDQTDDGRDKKYASGFNNFLFRSREGRLFNKILVSPFFVSSTVTPTIELPDICAGIVRNYYTLELDKRNANNDYEIWLSGLFSRVLKHTHNFYKSPNMFYGFYQMPKRCFVQNPMP